MNWKDKFPRKSIYFETENGILYCGHVLEILKDFPEESVDCIVTSPPYWNLRYYGEVADVIWDEVQGCKHEWGEEIKVSSRHKKGETNPGKEAWAKEKGAITDRAGKFCLKCKAWYGQLGMEPTLELYHKHLLQVGSEIRRVLKKTGTLWWVHGDSYVDKTLSLQNFRFIQELIDKQGWYLRNIIIWEKPNCMPSSVKDRFTIDYEPIFFLVKNKKYYFKQQVEPAKTPGSVHVAKNIQKSHVVHEQYNRTYFARTYETKDYRNKRCVWHINTGYFKEAHFAVYPRELIEPMISAGCPEDGIVLDPFMGSGTTGEVAEILRRRWVGIEINKDYCEIAKRRLERRRYLL